MQLSGLDGTNGDALDCVFTRSPNKVRMALILGVPVSTADDNGSLTAWKREDGKYGVSRDRYMVTQDRHTLTSIKAVVAWWKESLPKID